LQRRQKYLWLAFTIGSALLALQHGNWLELALRSGLHEASQAMLSAIAAALFCCVAWQIRPPPETPPPQ
jgi:Na+/H+ antiporter NhaC